MTAVELKAKIKSGAIGGAYLFAGEEDYLKKYYAGEIEKLAVPDEAFAPFNKCVFDGSDISFAELADAIESPPMMSDFKLIEWRYPDIDTMRKGELEKLEEIASAVSSSAYAVLVIIVGTDGFDHGTVKRPSKLAARLSKIFNLVVFDKSTDAQLISWLSRHFEAEGLRASQKALSSLIFRSGHSMEVLIGEVAKLSAHAKANSLSEITEENVALVASATLECDAFALSTAITDRNREGAFLALADMQQRRIDAGAALATLSRAFSELVTVGALADEGKDAGDIEGLLHWNAWKIKICISSAKRWGTARLTAALSRLRELDAASKSGGVSGYKVIEMFICEYI